MPTQLFYSVTIPVTLWFITKSKKQKGKTLFIDARKMGYMVDRKHRDFTEGMQEDGNLGDIDLLAKPLRISKLEYWKRKKDFRRLPQ